MVGTFQAAVPAQPDASQAHEEGKIARRTWLAGIGAEASRFSMLFRQRHLSRSARSAARAPLAMARSAKSEATLGG